MTGFLEKIREKLDMNWLSILLVLNLSIISFIATFRGFFAFFDLLGQDISNEWYFPFTLTIVVQTAILMAVWQIKGLPWHKKPLWILIYILCVIFSVGFGYAFWFDKMRADDLSKELSADTLLNVTSPIKIYVEKFNRLGDEIADIAAYSQAKSQEEAQQGGTCHPAVPRGRGQMAQYRSEDARLFNRLNAEVQAEIQQLESTLKDTLPADLTSRPVPEQEAELKSAIKLIRATFNPESLRQRILAAVDQQIARASRIVTSVVNGAGGLTEKQLPLCAPDVREKNAFRQRLVNLEFQDLADESEVVLLDAGNKREILNYAFGSILYRIFGWVGLSFGDADAVKYKSTIDDWIPLFLGLVVDLLIMLFSVRERPQIQYAQKTLKQLGDTVVSELMQHMQDEFPGMDAQQINETMEKHKLISPSFGWGDQARFIVRENESAPDALGVKNVMDSMEHLQLAKVKRHRAYRKLPRAFRSKVTRNVINPKMRREWLTDHYSVYEINNRLLWEIMTVLRRKIAASIP